MMSSNDTSPDSLKFSDDPGASRSAWLAAGLLIAIVVWMGIGFLLPSSEETNSTTVTEIAPIAVAIRASQAEDVTLFFQAEGQALPDRDTALRAEASGDVAEIFVNKGDDVEAGQIIARLVTTEVEAELVRAREELERAARELANAEALRERGVATDDRLVEAQSDLASAQADLTVAEQALERTNITAPFDGRLETLSLDEGEFIAAGTDVGRIVDNTPLTVSLQVPQQALNRVQNGQPAQVSFITGEVREGRVTFVGTSAAAETRTFLAEIEVQNEDGSIPAGISAEIRMPTGQMKAHFISPSNVSLSPNGDIGVKTVEDGVVAFHEVDVVRAEVDGIWVVGLPESVDLIAIGQGFVREGDRVEARPESVTIRDVGAEEDAS